MGIIINGKSIENFYISGEKINGFVKNKNTIYKGSGYFLLEYIDRDGIKHSDKASDESEIKPMIKEVSNMMKECKLSSINGIKAVFPRGQAIFFDSCPALEFVDLSDFDASEMLYMASVFQYCGALKTVNFSNFNTKSCTTFGGMFKYCSSLTELDLSSFTTEQVTNFYQMFYDCTSLTKIDLSSFTFNSNQVADYMFDGVPSNCLIYVKDQSSKDWILNNRNDLTNVQIKE